MREKAKKNKKNKNIKQLGKENVSGFARFSTKNYLPLLYAFYASDTLVCALVAFSLAHT